MNPLRAPFRLAMALIFAAAAGSGGQVSLLADAQAGSIGSLAVYDVRTPPVRAQGYDTRGVYPQVRAAGLRLGSVNKSVRNALVTDQRKFVRSMRATRRAVETGHPALPQWRGLYATHPRPDLISASSVVVSTLIPIVRAAFRGQSGSRGWLAITVLVPSGRRISISQIFADSKVGLRRLGDLWRAGLPPEERQCIASGAFGRYAPTPHFFRNFALLPNGIAIGVSTSGYCGAWSGTVPYDDLGPYLSALGRELVSGVRAPQ
jgi:hypothetical protein